MIRDLTALTCCVTTLLALVLTFARPNAPAPMTAPAPMITVDAPAPFDLNAFDPADVLWLNPDLTADAT